MHALLRQGLSMLAGGVIVAALLISPNVDAQDAPQLNPAGPVVVDGTTQTQHLVSYQGQLLNPSTGQPVPNGNYSIRFRVYDQATGGTTLFDVTQSLPVNNGFFSTVFDFAQSSTIFRGSARWIGVTVNNDPEATPRQPVAYVPYAFWARDADTLDSVGSEGFARSDDRRLPIAFGVVDNDGDRISGFNFNSNLGVENVYEIDIDGFDYNTNDFVTIVTPISQSDCPDPVVGNTNSFDDELLVEMRDRDGNTRRCKFHFVVYRP